ncbi:MAG: sugar transferase [Slackia isoflavoniconvertens]|nr:sugar transferase [Slackia isoflavoniconvertens]
MSSDKLMDMECLLDGTGDAKAAMYQAPAPDVTALAPKKGGVGYRIVKRAFDIVFSAGVCIVLAIPVGVACVAIAVDSPGAPFFRQKRVGKGGKPVYIFKLRTMVSDAHEHPEKYMSEEQLETWRREQKLDDDPRITKVGHFLRRTSLDEVPQFINVLIGDLAVIGPRPVTESETYEFGTARDEVLSCKPGITGWWAVTDRNDATWENGERQARELFYVRHASIGLDARVFFRTFAAMGRGK